MVLLDFCLKKYPHRELAVAHFDHGTRPSAKDDYAFVEKKCGEHKIKFFGKHAKLGAGVSEEKARKVRYEFFYSLLEAKDKLVVAHHLEPLDRAHHDGEDYVRSARDDPLFQRLFVKDFVAGLLNAAHRDEVAGMQGSEGQREVARRVRDRIGCILHLDGDTRQRDFIFGSAILFDDATLHDLTPHLDRRSAESQHYQGQ